jgi:cyclopropane fatty-acyl-phospholipid synthase-like methyltransferase
MDKPHSIACERNRDPILEVLRKRLHARQHVLEVGSGTGQHAVHFARHLDHLTWQSSDRAEMLPGIRLWLTEASLPNTPEPLALDVNQPWPALGVDAVFTANTLHIMSWDEVMLLFAHLPAITAPTASLVIYGPFKYGGRHTSDSNAAFEASLQAYAPHRAIRDFEAVDALARTAGFTLTHDHAMPANNRCLVWERSSPPL